MHWRQSLVMCLLLTTLVFPSPVDARSTYSGIASHYSPHVMEKVSHVRHMPVVSCMIASPYEKIGTWLTVKGLRTGKARRCRVTDICAPQDCRSIRERRIVAEIDWKNALAICGSRIEPDRKCPVRIIRGG